VKLLIAAALVLAASVAGAWVTGPGSNAQTVEVNIHHSRFGPESFEFSAGSRITFVIHNRDPIDHEFIVGDAAVQRRHENGTEMEHGAIPGEVSVPAGETRRTTYEFSKPSRLIIGCHLPGHYAYGMKARVRTS
jgi:uncharacterized cupredoxin-like copper-binding protein